MSLIRTGMSASFSLLSKLAQLQLPTNESTKNKIHDYSQFIWGSDYVFEPLNEGTEGYMTGIGKGVKPGHQIILRRGSELYKYQVEAIDYYCDPPDMWIGLLRKVLG
ncbi:MAG: hypothetical protein KME21_03885 [Desmonostoc vinosum HA7617-LM4]|jgi:MioC protein|nr:hypothetical protein [Desmonostoc vinosum HA7617-LM4]